MAKTCIFSKVAMGLLVTSFISNANAFSWFPFSKTTTESEKASPAAPLTATPHGMAADKLSPIKKILEANKKFSSDTIAFYKENNYQSVWHVGNTLNKAAEVALQVLREAANEGLNPKDYEEVEKALSGNLSAEEIDVILTNVFIHFIDDVRVGRIPPSHTARIIKIISPKTTPIKLLTEALEDSSYEKLKQMGPDIAEYHSLKNLLARYYEIEQQTPDLPKITNDKLKLGIKHPEVLALKKVLHTLGNYKGDLDTDEFNKELETALKTFQRCHFLDQTGSVNATTRKALNMPIKDRINKILINMERLRWLPEDDMTGRFILVNVGGYEVKAYNRDKLEIRMKAIVGKTATKTPLFYAPLKNIIVNPSWGVPQGIFMRDKLPKIINDPGYVQRSRFTIYDASGRVIDPDHADWANEGRSYHLRQSPGAHNALGRIKLNIENPYTIYLHGTPDEKLFNKEVRNFSSGCIRLQYPDKMAAWVLNSNDYSVDELEKMINSGGTKTLTLKEKINVYFTYQTVWEGDDGEVYFSPDAYQLDPTLEKLLSEDLKTKVETEAAAKTRFA